MRQDRRLHWLLLAPALILMAVMLYYPMFGTVYESFHETSFLNPDPKFAGLALYRRVRSDGTITQVLVN